MRPIAQGGMADVYLARQYGIGQFARHVAIKVLSHERADDADARAMFLDEARVCALLSHPNVASVLEVDVAGDVHYLAMEYVHGVDLREVTLASARAGRTVAPDVAVAIVAQAAAGLDHAHRRVGPDGAPLGLVHRDISLSNLMCGYDGAVKVVDFGIAKSAIATTRGTPGIVRGKASYMSPEQCLGDEVDLRTDVFALGVVLYELATGLRCFDGPGDFERMLAVVRGEYTAPSAIDPEFPDDLEAVIRTALAVDASQRYASAGALLEALERVARARGWSLGTTTVARAMRGLFGEVPEPWAAQPSVELAAVCAGASERTLRQPMVAFAETMVAAPRPDTQPTPRRWPAGSMHSIPRRAVDTDDDALTGRRRFVCREPSFDTFDTPLAA
nr:serine/threonine-protein kinase [Kofleriaceae bacterium]